MGVLMSKRKTRLRRLVCRKSECVRTANFDTLRAAHQSDWGNINDYGIRCDRSTIEHQGDCPHHADDASGDTTAATDSADDGDDTDDERVKRLQEASHYPHSDSSTTYDSDKMVFLSRETPTSGATSITNAVLDSISFDSETQSDSGIGSQIEHRTYTVSFTTQMSDDELQQWRNWFTNE